MNTPNDKRSSDDPVGQLIQKSGRGPAATPDARARIYKAVHSEWQRSLEQDAPGSNRPLYTNRFFSRFNFSFAAAAAVVIAVGLVGFFSGTEIEQAIQVASIEKTLNSVDVHTPGAGDRAERAGTGRALLTGERIVTGGNGAVAVNLANGDSLRLDANTEVLFVSANEIELERGAVYLDSAAANDFQSFTVTTSYGVVRHVGTQYEVRLGTQNVAVRVREGSVSIANDSQELVAEAGELLLIPQTGPTVRAPISASDSHWQWTENLAVLATEDDYLLGEVLPWIARQTGRELRFENQETQTAAQALILHGIGGLTPDELFDVIQATTGLRYQLTDEDLTVY